MLSESMPLDSPLLVSLPVSRTTISNLIDAQSKNGNNASTVVILEKCSVLEFAGLCVLQRACLSRDSGCVELPSSIQLERAMGVLVDKIQEGGGNVRSVLTRELSRANWRQITESLSSMDISLMDEQDVDANASRCESGVWDSAAEQHQRYRKSNSESHSLPYFYIPGIKKHSEQDVLLHELAKNPNDSLVLQGVAGCGKTTLVIRLSHLFNSQSTLYLSKDMGQIKSISDRLGKSVNAWSFDYLMRHILFFNWNGRVNWGNRYQLRPLSYHQLSGLLHIEPMNGLSAETVAKIVDLIVTRYCESSDAFIADHHCPWQLDGLSTKLYIELAKTYWEKIKELSTTSSVPILGVHVLKLVAENNIDIPVRFKNIIVDESHDLPASLESILKRSHQAIITLGDQYQMTSGEISQPSLEAGVRGRNLFQSMRAGNDVDAMFNRLLEMHTVLEIPGVFEGARDKTTSISSYTQFSPPDVACAILTRDYWYSFIAIIQLSNAGRPFFVLPSTLFVLRTLIPQSLSYFHGYEEQRSHSQLMGYSSWKELVASEGQNNGLKEVDAFFRQGFTAKQFKEVLAGQSKGGRDCYVVGRVEDAKSREMRQVMVAPDVFDAHMFDKKNQRTRMLNLIYTGMTRALDGIMLPKVEADWLLEG